jgi:ribosomal protein S18 acetylase RimI-like enzyme
MSTSGLIRVTMIRPHMRDIPQVDFPTGFRMRPMRLDEIATWTDVIRDAEEHLEISDDKFMEQFGSDLAAVPERCFFVVDEADTPIGTVSAWYSHDFKDTDYGRIHWMAIRPPYQGRGLGKAALSLAMNRLAEHHERAWLSTATIRIPAIKMYLNFGFLPDIESPSDAEAWQSVLGHSSFR